MKASTRIALLTGVAIPFAFAGSPPSLSEETSVAESHIVVAQADNLAAAEAEVAAAQAALEEAIATGGDVAAAQARLDAALSALAAARAEPQSEPEPEQAPVEPQPEPEAEPEPPPQTEPQPELPPEPPQQPEPPTLEAPAEPPEIQQPLEQEAPPAEPAPQQPSEPNAAPPPELQAPTPNEPSSAEEPPPPEREQTDQPAPGQSAPEPEETPEAETPPAPPPTAGEPPPPVLPAPTEPTTQDQQGTVPPTAGEPEQPDAPPAAEQEESAVEQQLEAQGDEEAVENVRTLRDKLRGDLARQSDSEVQADGRRGDRDGDAERRDGDRDGRDRDGRDRDRRDRDRPDDEGEIVFDFGGRFIIELGDQLVIRQDSAHESDRFLDRARDVNVEHFPGGYTRTAVTRRDGSTIYTVRNRYGDIITRTRIDRRGRVIVLIDNRDFYREGRRPRYVRYEDELPPLRLDIPREQYIVETSRVDRDTIRAALLAPPVEAVEHPYALEEIRNSERLRSKVRRVDLNTITFDFGSAAISRSQFDELAEVGWAMENIIADSPGEVFLVEGHTDAVGSDTDNLILSDRRAEAIAVALSTNFDIPPENLVTQGYGEHYLKVPTEEPERENRRVTVRRITPLVAQAR